jgi:hypothetical protein
MAVMTSLAYNVVPLSDTLQALDEHRLIQPDHQGRIRAIARLGCGEQSVIAVGDRLQPDGMRRRKPARHGSLRQHDHAAGRVDVERDIEEEVRIRGNQRSAVRVQGARCTGRCSINGVQDAAITNGRKRGGNAGKVATGSGGNGQSRGNQRGDFRLRTQHSMCHVWGAQGRRIWRRQTFFKRLVSLDFDYVQL